MARRGGRLDGRRARGRLRRPGVGRHARDLDAAHRRDGLGLAFLAAAVLSAAVTWGHLGSGLGRLLGHVIRGSFGRGALAIPVLLGLRAWRLLRHPDRNAETGRVVIGWSALLVGALGLVHVANGAPGPSAGAPALRAAGGLIGFAVSAPLVAGLTAWVAVPVLALVAGFGVLVVTGTPVHQIGTRLAEFRALLQGRRLPPPASAMPGEEGDPLRRPLPRGRRRGEPLEAGDHERPYDTPLLGGMLSRPGSASGRDAAALPAGCRRGRGRAAGRRAVAGRRGTTRRKRPCPGPGRRARAGRRPRRGGRPGRGRPGRGDRGRAEQGRRAARRRAAHAVRVHRRDLHAAARHAAPGRAPRRRPGPGPTT